jgi:hypothetical protein
MANSKRRNALAENWISYPRSMLESCAFQVLGHTATRVMRRIEIEHLAHGGAENGKLIVTYDQFEEYGVSRNSVGPAIRELVALGFLEITEKGIASNENGRPNRFRLTYVNVKTREQPTNEWRRVMTIEQANRLAKEARAEKDPRARALGSRGARARVKKQNSITTSDTGSVTTTDTEGAVSQSQLPILLSSVTTDVTTIYNLGGEASPSRPTHAARLSWSRPRFRELDPVTDEPIDPWLPRTLSSTNAQHAASAQLTVDVPTPHASTSALVH